MGLEWRRRRICERAARSISLRLDGELSELGQAALERHLRGCAACRALADETAGLTALLRSAPPVVPDRPLRVELHRRPRSRALRRFTAIAAVVGMLAAAGAGTIVVGDPSERSARAHGALVFTSDQEQWSYALMQQLRLEPWSRATVVATPRPLVGRVLL